MRKQWDAQTHSRHALLKCVDTGAGAGNTSEPPTIHARYKRSQIHMKTMTCRELGGTCDQKLSANSWDEMVKVMTQHVMDKHPDVAKQMEKMHNEDPKRWGKEMRPKWDAAPDV